MPGPGEAIPSSLSLYMRYRDVGAAVDWLTSTLGFERHTVLKGPDGEVLHAELKFGQGLIMIGPVRNSDFDQYLQQPDEADGRETQTCYLTCDDADAVYQRARAAGAEILLDVEGDTDGRRGFSCRDPQGHIWSIGTYDPWQGALKVEPTSEPPPPPPSKTGEPAPQRATWPLKRAAGLAAAAGVGTAAVLFGIVSFLPATSPVRAAILGVSQQLADDETVALRPLSPDVETGAIHLPPEQSAAERLEAEQTMKALRAALERERADRAAAEEAARKADAEQKRAAEQARILVDALKAESQRLQRDNAASEDSLRRVKAELEQAQKTREAAERAAKTAEATLASERKRRLETEAELEEAVKTMAGKPSLTGQKAPEIPPKATTAVVVPAPELGPSAPVTAVPEAPVTTAVPADAEADTQGPAAATSADKKSRKAAEPPKKRQKQAAKPAGKSKPRGDGGEKFTAPLNLP